MIRNLRRLLGRQEDSLAVQSIILTAARTAGFVITFAIPIILVRVFDQSGFGIYKQLFLIIGTALPILNVGMYASLFYFIPRDEGEGHRYVMQALGFLTLMGALAGGALVLAGDAVNSLMGGGALRAYIPLLALLILVGTPAYLLVAVPTVDRRPVIAGYTIAGNDLLRALALIGAAIFIGTIEAVLWAALASYTLSLIWLLVYIYLRKAPEPRRANLRDLGGQLRYSVPFAVAVLFQTALIRFHQYYVAGNVSAETFAIYAVGILQIPVVGWFVQSVVEVMLVRASQAHKDGDLAELKRLWKIALERLMVILVAGWALAELLAPDLIGLLFGVAYLPAVPVMRIFLLTLPLMIFVDHAVLRATGDTPFLLVANIVGFVASAIAVIALSRYSVLLGGVTGYVIGLSAMRVMGLLKIAQRLHVHWYELIPWATLGRVVVAAGACTALAALALVLPSRIARLGVAALIFSAAYILVILAWEVIPRREVHQILRRIVPAYPLGR